MVQEVGVLRVAEVLHKLEKMLLLTLQVVVVMDNKLLSLMLLFQEMQV
jgi:hypothetical protein